MRLANLEPFQQFVQDPMTAGKFISAQFCQLAAGPPFLSKVGEKGSNPSLLGKDDVVLPIGITQTWAVAQNKALARIFEIGSYRSYFIGSHAVGQLTLARVYYHGASLLRFLYAYYADDVSPVKFDAMYENNFWKGTHDVQVPPGYQNLFLNLGSDLFNSPVGILFVIRDSDKACMGAVYFEQCYVPAYNIGTDAQGSIVQEGVGIQYERMVPVDVAGSVELMGLSSMESEDPALLEEVATLAAPGVT